MVIDQVAAVALAFAVVQEVPAAKKDRPVRCLSQSGLLANADRQKDRPSPCILRKLKSLATVVAEPSDGSVGDVALRSDAVPDHAVRVVLVRAGELQGVAKTNDDIMDAPWQHVAEVTWFDPRIAPVCNTTTTPQGSAWSNLIT